MAFRMNRPIIKGTANHKASIAKAKAESIVSQRRTQADAGLVSAADTLGKSYKPQAIDYSIDQKGIEFLDIKKEKKKEKQPKVKKSKSDYGDYEEYLAEEKELQKNIDDKGYQAYLDQESGSGTSDENLPSREQWEKNLKKPSYKPLSKKDWTDLNVEAGMKRPKVKKEKGENIFEKGYKGIRDFIKEKNEKITAKKKQNKLDFQAEQKDKSIIQAEKDAAKLEADKLKQAELDKKEIEKALALERRNEEKLKKRLIREEAAERRKNRNKKEIIDVGEVKTTGIGDQQINQQTRQYTKEQREKLNTGEEGGNIWSNDLERYVLPEEIVDGQFVSKAEGETIIVSPNIKGKTTEPVVEEKKTLSNLEIRKKRMRDRKYNDPNTSQYIKDQMLKEGYVPNESKSPANMRDNRIYRNAIKGGAVQRNMIKSGYKPE